MRIKSRKRPGPRGKIHREKNEIDTDDRNAEISCPVLENPSKLRPNHSISASVRKLQLVADRCDIAALNRFQPRSNSTHSACQIRLGHQTAADHGMHKCEQLTFGRRYVYVYGL